MAIRIGITGGIGSGKTVVSRLLGLLGIPVYISDTEAKRLMMSDRMIHKELVELIGPEVYAGGILDRQLLASYIFGNREHLRRVNAIVHPRVRTDFRKWAETQASSHKLVGIESAILLEAGFAADVDVLAVVYAPLEVRITRAMKRDASTREAVESRIRQQMDDEQKLASADFVIINDGETALIPQVLQLASSLCGKDCLTLPRS